MDRKTLSWERKEPHSLDEHSSNNGNHNPIEDIYFYYQPETTGDMRRKHRLD